MSMTFQGYYFHKESGCWEYVVAPHVPCDCEPDEDGYLFHCTHQVDLSLNLSNHNAINLADALGLKVGDGMVEECPVDEFITRCENYLQSLAGEPDPGQEGYLQERARRLIGIAHRARELGATHMLAG